MSSEKKTFINKKRKVSKKNKEIKQSRPYKKKKESLSSEKKEIKKVGKSSIKVEEPNNLKTIIPISQYFSNKLNEYSEEKQIPDLKIYCESIEINAESNFKLLDSLIDSDLDSFINLYPKYQFTLSVEQRKSIQKKINEKNIKICDDYPIIKKNFIKDEIKSVRELFLKICELILNIKLNNKDFLTTLETQIINEGVFIDNSVEFFIPVIFGNTDLKFNKLLIDLLCFIFGKKMGHSNSLNEEEFNLIKTKISQFKDAKIFYQKSGMFDDETFFKVNDYLINCFYILFEVDDSLKDYENFEKILSCCLPFEKSNAINFINESQNFGSRVKFKIDDVIIDTYDSSKITKDSIINISNEKLNIEAKAEDINWTLTPNTFFRLINSSNFTFCFRFPKLNDINYVNLNKDIKNNYKILFKKILQSNIMEQCMNIDSEASKFKYPFKDENIIKEIEEHCLFVPFPAKNYFGFSDRMSFTIYLNSYIDPKNFKTIFVDFDNLIKSGCHEVKHIYRLYMHINEPNISLKTPEINRKSLANNELIKENTSLIQKKNEKIEKLYNERVIPKSEINSLDYGDILEFAINGEKQDVFFIKNSLFCLKEKSWDMEPKKFSENYFKFCKEKKFRLMFSKEDKFINSVMEFFKIPRGIDVINEAITSKRSTHNLGEISFEGEIENTYISIPKMNHCRIKK